MAAKFDQFLGSQDGCQRPSLTLRRKQQPSYDEIDVGISQPSQSLCRNQHPFQQLFGFLNRGKTLGVLTEAPKDGFDRFFLGFPLKWGSPKTLVGEWKILLK